MNQNEKNDKARETLSNIWQKTADVSKKAARGIQQGAKTLSEQTKEGYHNYQVNKYNPLTAKEFKSKNFSIPNVIEIVDAAVRRDIEVCEGAIGWLEMHKGVEILHLYDEYVKKSGLQFVPVDMCNNVYYMDAFDHNKFINVNDVFAKTTEEKLAELENIAYCLGAKCCSVEIVSSETDETTASMSAGLGKTSASVKSTNKGQKKGHGKAVSNFVGHDTPKEPALKWFAHDDSIKALIEMRCADVNSIKSRTLELKSSSSTTMSVKIAGAIDKILKVKGSVSMEKQAIKELSNRLLFEVEF